MVEGVIDYESSTVIVIFSSKKAADELAGQIQEYERNTSAPQFPRWDETLTADENKRMSSKHDKAMKVWLRKHPATYYGVDSYYFHSYRVLEKPFVGLEQT